MTTPVRRFPFSAIVGQDDARLALLLAAVDPAIGGVLLRGEKGTAKSTMARSLAGLLPGGAPFVELPLGTTEERVIGTLDPHADSDETAFLPGLLAAAHGGVLYVDEVNLLPGDLVDALLDVAASGVNRVERPGLSHEHPARFVLVGSMNPEEGELRPQFLDRFGLAVEVVAPEDPAVRAEIVRRRLAHDAGDQVTGTEADIVLRARLAAAIPAELPDEIVDFACRLAVSVGAEGLRADLVLCRAAAAYAGWSGRSVTTEADIEQVASLALGHRRRRPPFAPPTMEDHELQQALASVRSAFAEDDGARPSTETRHPTPIAVPALDDLPALTVGSPTTPDRPAGEPTAGDRTGDGTDRSEGADGSGARGGADGTEDAPAHRTAGSGGDGPDELGPPTLPAPGTPTTGMPPMG